MIDEMKFPIKALDNWTLTQKLSDSGQSTTYHVTGKKDGQRGVLKLQNKRPGGAERLKTEAAILSSVNHRNVVKLLDTNASSTDTVIYLVTEWIPGPTLTQMINNTRANLQEALVTCECLYEALSYLHNLQRPVLHRDIKPDNILMKNGSYADPVLIDFGIAYKNRATNLTGMRERIGNYFLELPEATEGVYDKRDCCSDVTYVAGILLYMLTAKYPKKILETRYGSMPHERRRSTTMLAQLTHGQREGLTRFFNKAFQFGRRKRIQHAQCARQILTDIREESLRQYPVTALTGARFAHSLGSDMPNLFDFCVETREATYRNKILDLIMKLGKLHGLEAQSPRTILKDFAVGQEEHEKFLAEVHNNESRGLRVESDTRLLLQVFDLLMECPDESSEVWTPFVQIVGPALSGYISAAIRDYEESEAEAWYDKLRDM